MIESRDKFPELDCCSKRFMEADMKEGINLRRCINIPIDTEPDDEDGFFFSDGCFPLTRYDKKLHIYISVKPSSVLTQVSSYLIANKCV